MVVLGRWWWRYSVRKVRGSWWVEKAVLAMFVLSMMRMVPGGAFMRAASIIRMRLGWVVVRWVMKFSGTVPALIRSTWLGRWGRSFSIMWGPTPSSAFRSFPTPRMTQLWVARSASVSFRCQGSISCGV